MRGLGNSGGSERRRVARRGRPASAPVGRILAAAAAAALIAAGCGQEQPAELGTGVAVPTTVATTTTTIATTTTTTIDFNRPITQATAALADDIDQTDIAALAADIRGQTADVAIQMQRLSPFLDVVVAPVAQIIDVDIALAPENDDDLYPSTATVSLRVPDTGPDIVMALTDRFEALAWFSADQRNSTTDGTTVTESVFRFPGIEADELEFRSVVTAEPGLTVLELTYVTQAVEADVENEDGTTYFERFSSWQTPIGLTRVAELSEVGVTTGEASGQVFARYLMSAEDEAEAIELLVGAIARGDYELVGATAEEPPTSGPLSVIDETGNTAEITVSPATAEETFQVEATYTFDLTPLD